MKSLRKIFNFYYRYIQPLMGLGLIGMGAMYYFSPGPGMCTETECVVSVLPEIKPLALACIGLAVLALWFKDVVWNPGGGDDDKDTNRKGRVKPEDFVK